MKYALNRPLSTIWTPAIVFIAAIAVVLTMALFGPSSVRGQATEDPCSQTEGSVIVTCTYAENGTGIVADFSAMDPEQAGVVWSVRGTDRGMFTAEGGELRFNDSPNYENPQDEAHTADGDDADTDPDFTGDTDDIAENNIYVVVVRATEVVQADQVEPAKYDELLVRVTVTNVDETGEIDIVVRQPQVGVALTATASDPDTRNADGSANDNGTGGTAGITWQWSVPKLNRPDIDNDNHWGNAPGSGNGSATYTPDAADVGSILRAQATYTDGTGEERTLNILTEFAVRAEVDAADNNAPNAFDSGDTDRSVDENSPKGTLVGAPVTTTDSNPGDVLYYTLTGPDAASFAIDKVTGQITVDGEVNHEGGGDGGDGVYDVTITAIDPSGTTTTTVDIDIEAKDVNEAPTVTEDAGADKTTDEIDSTPDDPANYTYASGLANLTYTKADVDDGDETTFSLAGDDAGQFNMAVAADVLTLSFKSPPDYDKPGDADKDNTYKVSVVATDKAGLKGMADVEIVVSDIAEDGTVTVSPSQPAIGQPVTATLNEPDTEVSGLEWQWQSSSTATGTFADIEGATSDTYTPREAIPDDPATTDVNESRPTDEGMFLRAVATYTDKPSPLDTSTTDDLEDQEEQTAMGDSAYAVRAKPDVNNAPAFESATIAREVREDATSGADVGAAVTAADPEGDDLTYAITGGADMDKFTNDGAQIQVGSATFDYDDSSAQQTFMVELTATDPFGMSGSTMVTITVTDFNEPPDFEAPDDIDDYDENGTGAVATFTGPDPEGAAVIWSVRGTDEADFTIDGGVLRFAKSPDYEVPTDDAHTADTAIDGDTDDAVTNNVYVIKVRATEDAPDDQEEPAKYTEHQIRVTVANVDETGMASILIRQPQVSVALEATASDPDTRDATGTEVTNGTGTVAWQWSVPKLNRPVTDNNDHWTPAAGSPSDQASYTPAAGDVGKVLRAQGTYTDGTGEVRTVNVLTEFAVRAVPDGTNDNPVFPGTGVYTRTVAENSDTGTLLGAPVTATDANGDVLYYTIPATSDANPFAIDKITGQITVAGTVHFEPEGGNGGTYTITVTATDPSAGTDSQAVTVTVTDVNEAPTVTETTGAVKSTPEIDSTPADGDPAYTSAISATYTRTDPDAADTGAGNLPGMSLAGDDKDLFDLTDENDDGTYDLAFKDAPDFDKPGDADKDNMYVVMVVATDKAGLTGMVEVKIEVTDVSEDGTVTVSPSQPAIGRPVTATLDEPDTEVSGLKWKWQSSQTGADGSWLDIEGATSDTYTPKEAVPDDPATTDVDESADSDEGIFLRAVVTYIDKAAPLDTTTADDLEDQVEQTAMGDSENAVRATPTVNNPPGFPGATMRIEVEENTPAGDDVGEAVTATDPDGDVLTYSFSGGADQGKFRIDDETGQITVGTGTELDFEAAQTSYEVVVKADDPFGMSDTVAVTIVVTNMNEAPSLTLGTTPVPTPTPTPDPSISPYDANNDGEIDKGEVLVAIDDYFDQMITKAEVLEVIDLYFE